MSRLVINLCCYGTLCPFSPDVLFSSTGMILICMWKFLYERNCGSLLLDRVSRYYWTHCP
jgi:predicted membrane-bound dolichyl-phosphate-mannose-protein mannosyltransferase